MSAFGPKADIAQGLKSVSRGSLRGRYKSTLRQSVLVLGWSPQSGVSLSVDKAQAHTRVVVRSYVHGPYYALSGAGLPWYAVRAYYADGPWSGPGV